MDIQTWIIIGAFFLVVLLKQFGRKKFSIRNAIWPFIISGIIIKLYVKDIPTSGNDIVGLGLMIAAGILFGIAILFTVKVEWAEGKAFTIAGIPYLLLWILGLGWRLLLSNYAEHWNPQGFMKFMITHKLDVDIIAPAFISFTIAMFVTRTLGIALRLQMIRKKSTSSI
ncbi:hypothetical protein LCM14_05670 [Priestia aryabhattai]|uniref:DUF1453 domain-containing protein n=1 Tax=Priestia megaterium TaxID=1404 RepID=A0AAX6BHV4_PRIMG|nr:MULTISPECIES: hypothetical protein [Priestia]MCA1049278.1 hypothetical protein [Priestia aryabhattai]MED3816322.1 hypothetical protein [Priestia aryabhattai]GMG73325.1 hypothetical protein ShirakiTB12_17930 [Priestia megaterium]